MEPGSFAALTSQRDLLPCSLPPYMNRQHFGLMQAAPVWPPLQPFGLVQGAPVILPYSYNLFGAMQAALVGGCFNPPVVTNNTYVQQVVQVTVPKTNVVVVEPPERNCYFY